MISFLCTKQLNIELKFFVVAKRRRNLLKQVNVRKSSELTPKARKFYTTLKKWSVTISKQQKKITSFEERLANFKKVTDSDNYKSLLRCVNNSTYHFIMCQIRNQILTPRARRYTLDEKILALSLYKGSGKGYKLLHKIFALPSPKTLNNLLQRILVKPGINEQLFQSLKAHVNEMKDEREKVCALIFDEMELSPSIHYDRKQDKITGFHDNGRKRIASFANHVNVFMIKGIFRHWKQPIVFTFSNGAIQSSELKLLIVSIIRQCFSAGLNIVTTICDQGSTNRAAINMLLKETNDYLLKENQEINTFGFMVDGKEIIPLYDFPHLFKGIRNNLLNKHLHFKLNGESKIAKWDHIIKFYELDSSDPDLITFPKLTDEHVIPSKIRKMKVKLCTQVFSHTVGSMMKKIAQWGKIIYTFFFILYYRMLM